MHGTALIQIWESRMDKFHLNMDKKMKFPFINKKVVLKIITHISGVLEQMKMPSIRRRKNKRNGQHEMWKHPL